MERKPTFTVNAPPPFDGIRRRQRSIRKKIPRELQREIVQFLRIQECQKLHLIEFSSSIPPVFRSYLGWRLWEERKILARLFEPKRDLLVSTIESLVKTYGNAGPIREEQHYIINAIIEFEKAAASALSRTEEKIALDSWFRAGELVQEKAPTDLALETKSWAIIAAQLVKSLNRLMHIAGLDRFSEAEVEWIDRGTTILGYAKKEAIKRLGVSCVTTNVRLIVDQNPMYITREHPTVKVYKIQM